MSGIKTVRITRGDNLEVSKPVEPAIIEITESLSKNALYGNNPETFFRHEAE